MIKERRSYAVDAFRFQTSLVNFLYTDSDNFRDFCFSKTPRSRIIDQTDTEDQIATLPNVIVVIEYGLRNQGRQSTGNKGCDKRHIIFG